MMAKEIKIIPEHVIISCDIEADGYREVTLRTRPRIPGKTPFGFYVVEGGLQRHPEFNDAWKTGVEVVGEVYKKDGEGFIKISSIRPLTKLEYKAKDVADYKLWEEICADDSPNNSKEN